MKRKRETGFTLVELLIALFILTVALLSISSMVYSVMMATENSKETSAATTLMQDRMESLKNIPQASLNSGSDTVTRANISYQRTWTVTRNPSTNNYQTIEVRVDWTNRGAHSVTMTTLRAD